MKKNLIITITEIIMNETFITFRNDNKIIARIYVSTDNTYYSALYAHGMFHPNVPKPFSVYRDKLSCIEAFTNFFAQHNMVLLSEEQTRKLTGFL